jgi:hypothetical protein
MGFGRTCPALALALAGLACASDRDVAVPLLPEETRGLQATLDGGAWLIGTESGGGSPSGLWRFEAGDRPPRRIAIPGNRQPLAMAWSQEDRSLWLAGSDWVALLTEDGSFRFVALNPQRDGDLVVTGPGRATFMRHVYAQSEWSAEVVTLRRQGDELVFTKERFTGNRVSVHLGAVVADGRGGFWTFIHTFGEPHQRGTGYLHRGQAGWRAWMPDGLWPDFVEPPPGLTVAGATPPELGGELGGRFLVADGAGGFYFQTDVRDGFFRVLSGGEARLIEPSTLPSRGVTMFWNDVAFDRSRSALLFLTGGSRSPDFDHPASTQPVRFSLFDGQRVIGEERLPFPAWGRTKWRRGRAAAAGGVWWAAYPGLVLRHADGGWVRFSSQQMKDRLSGERRRHAGELATEIAGGLLGAALVLLGGAFLSGRARGERPVVAALRIATIGLIAAPPGMLALATNPLVHGQDEYGISIVLCAIGVGVQTALGAVGAWFMGKLLDGRPRGSGAPLGAIAGAAVGAIVGLLLDGRLHDRLVPVGLDVQAFRWALAIGLCSVFATLGYQVASGKPAPRA